MGNDEARVQKDAEDAKLTKAVALHVAIEDSGRCVIEAENGTEVSILYDSAPSPAFASSIHFALSCVLSVKVSSLWLFQQVTINLSAAACNGTRHDGYIAVRGGGKSSGVNMPFHFPLLIT